MGAHSLSELLDGGTVRAKVPAVSWRNAVDAAGGLLVAAGACEPGYVDAMRAAAREFGPYIVIAPGIAMPHARPEQGVLRPGIALVTLARPVEFGHRANDPVDLVIPFAAVDKDAHLSTLQKITELLMDPDAVAAVRAAETDQELRAVLGVPNGEAR